MKPTPEHPNQETYRTLISARKSKGLTQVQLSQKTGIAQCDISRMETGQANPSIKTLKRLAAGMDMNISIEFLPA